MKKILIISAALFLSACATGYHQENFFTGGFKEAQLDKNVFRVSFKGNGYTNTDHAEEMVLLRSADIALKNGFTHFIIASSRSNSDYSLHATPGQANIITKPSTTNTIICYNGKPDNQSFSYDAQYLYDSLSKKHDIKK
jgi:hypothetical protein